MGCAVASVGPAAAAAAVAEARPVAPRGTSAMAATCRRSTGRLHVCDKASGCQDRCLRRQSGLHTRHRAVQRPNCRPACSTTRLLACMCRWRCGWSARGSRLLRLRVAFIPGEGLRAVGSRMCAARRHEGEERSEGVDDGLTGRTCFARRARHRRDFILRCRSWSSGLRRDASLGAEIVGA